MFHCSKRGIIGDNFVIREFWLISQRERVGSVSKFFNDFELRIKLVAEIIYFFVRIIADNCNDRMDRRFCYSRIVNRDR